MTNRYFYLTIIGLFFYSQLLSQAHSSKENFSTISGHVVEKGTGLHIPYATIKIEETGAIFSVDGSGHFHKVNIPSGKYRITASSLGYISKDTIIDLLPTKTSTINLELLESSLNMNEVVVTATRNVSKRRESPSVINVLGKKLFEQSASTNLSQALNFQSGVRVEVSCQNCAVTQVRINGLEGQYSQILLDSRPIFSSLATVYGVEQLPASMVERVEVLRGGGSAIFGSNAIGGVINIITKEPIKNTLSVSNQTAFLGNGSLDFTTSLNGSFVSSDFNTGVYLFGMIRDRDSYDRDEDGFSDIPVLNGETIGLRGYHKFNPNARLTLEYHHMNEYRRGGDSLSRPPHEATVAEQVSHRIDGGGFKLDLNSQDYKHRISFFSSAQKIGRDSYFGTNKDLNAYGRTDDFTLSAGSQYSLSIKRLFFLPAEFTAGVEYNYNYLKDAMLGYNRVIDQMAITYGGYIQNEWKNDKTSILIGARLDKNNFVKNPIFSPRINIRYSPSKNLIFRGTFSSGYRAPQAYSEDLHVEAVGGNVTLIVIDPNLRPEYSNSIGASADYYFFAGSVQMNILAEVFHTNLKDVFALEPIGRDEAGNILLQRKNESGAIISGANIEAKANYGNNFSAQAGFTIQSSRYKELYKWSDDENATSDRRMHRTPNKYGYITISWNPISVLNASATCVYTGSMLMPHFAGYISNDRLETTPSFLDLGFKVAYDIKFGGDHSVQISTGIKNILDSYQKDLDRGALRDAGYVYGPGNPRIIYVGIKLDL
jgi:outer membrane receptor for ferrienterochelin and colicins